MKFYPGSLVEMKDLSGKQFLDNLCDSTRGIVMSQLKDMLGIGIPTIQNWFARGFVSRPVNKRYSKDQVARILIINMLRKSMSLDKISALLYYINGNTEDESDDIINESELYGYICDIVTDDSFNRSTINQLIASTIAPYKEKLEGAKDRLAKALKIICLYFLAQTVLVSAENYFLDAVKC